MKRRKNPKIDLELKNMTIDTGAGGHLGNHRLIEDRLYRLEKGVEVVFIWLAILVATAVVLAAIIFARS